MEFGSWVALLVFIGMLVLVFLGVPIFIAVAGAALVGSLIVGGASFTLQQFAALPYFTTSTFTFAVVPLFILMSVLAADVGIADAAYEAASKWFGRLRGGMLIGTVVASAIFGAACGQFLAAAAVFAKTALPQLNKYNYDRSLSMGCIATSGTLSVLIPPSVPIIIFCILLDVSIGRALVAGIIPGLILTVMLSLVIIIIGRLRPETMPSANIQVSWKERFKSITLVGPVLFIIALVIGGMYLGVFAPTVGGAIGSMGVLLIAAIRRVKLSVIAHSFYETVLINAQIFPLLIGGFLFARFILLSGLSGDIMQLIGQSNLHPLVLMLIVIIFYLFIGCVLEFLSIAVITLPLVFPVLTAAGFDPIATLIIIIMLSQIATITPPLGMAAFAVASIAGVKSEEVFRGIIPFFIVCLLLTVMIVLYPQIATWLPNLFYG
ncbi:MAG TPA: TRAP transporter large permease [Dehalococcoidia bacterium]|nr:TRAP transporter large permease [Dehalococcoidia bacterium]